MSACRVVWRGLLLCCVCAVWGWGCAGQEGSCTKDDACEVGKRCVEQRCTGPQSVVCESSVDCPQERKFCHAQGKRCVVCIQDDNCNKGEGCTRGLCVRKPGVECSSDADCRELTQKVCSDDGRCAWDCRSDRECGVDRLCLEHRCKDRSQNDFCVTDADCTGKRFRLCSRAGNCEWECRQDGDCTGGSSCVENRCSGGTGGCSADDACKDPALPRCDKANKACVSCLVDGDCKDASKPRCDMQTKACVGGCASDGDCKDASEPKCAQGVCVGCVADGDCKDASKPKCAQGACVGCVADGDCKDASKPRCDVQTKACVGGCASDGDCKDASKPKCAQGVCVGCVADGDCKDASKPVCQQGVCVPKQAQGGCGGGCAAGEFCSGQDRCLPEFKACTDSSECTGTDACIDVGGNKAFCLPVCDPTQNKSSEDLHNKSCWNDYGLCYGLSDTDPKDGACFPPQQKIRAWKEVCNDETSPGEASYHLCLTGLVCLENGAQHECWKPCDPQKNAGGKVDEVALNPDCEAGAGKCHPLEGGGGACEPATTTPGARAPKVGELVINEVLADPATGSAGDANKDGTRDATDDEFIEIVNASQVTLRLDGVSVQVGTDKVYTFGSGVQLLAGKALVIFGGGLAGDTTVNSNKGHPKFGQALVFRANNLKLANAGKTLTLLDAGQGALASFAYGSSACPGDKDQSVTRAPDVTGTCKLHKTASSSQAAFSPGTKLDGSSF